MENSRWAETLYEAAMKQVGKGTHNVSLLTHLLCYCCQICNSDFCVPLQRVLITLGHTVAQLVEALRYKPEGRGFDPRWCH